MLSKYGEIIPLIYYVFPYTIEYNESGKSANLCGKLSNLLHDPHMFKLFMKYSRHTVQYVHMYAFAFRIRRVEQTSVAFFTHGQTKPFT